jgi:hypothetical protein
MLLQYVEFIRCKVSINCSIRFYAEEFDQLRLHIHLGNLLAISLNTFMS